MGILIVFLVALILYYRGLTIEKDEVVPPELAPIKNYIEDCIAQTAEEALLILGEQGGFIEIPSEIEQDSKSYIENGFYKIPFWYYERKTRIPPLTREDGSYSIEEQIGNYVKNNIENCFQNLSIFREKFEIEEMGNMIAKATIAKSDVIIELKRPLKITTKGKDEVNYITKFSKKIDVRLKDIYTIATAIMNYENNNMFFENMTINLMSMNPEIPFTNIELHCGYMKWLLSDIKKNLQDMVYYNMQKVRVDQTDYLPFAAEQSVYDELSKYTMEDILKGNYPETPLPEDAYDYFNHFMRPRMRTTDLKVNFIYQPHYGMDILARPSSNDVLSSELQKSPVKYLSYLCLNLYHFTYDVIYPLQTAIRDDTAFNNGYIFRFAFPVLIDHNEGNRDITGHAVFQSPSTYVDYCSDLGGKEYDIRALGTDEYGLTNMELNDVNISYNCHKFICSLGTTRPDQGAYRLRTMLPLSCSYGYIVAQKEGYLKKEVQVLDNEDIDIPLMKLKELDFKVVKHKLLNNNIGTEQEIADYEEALLYIESKDQQDHISYKRYPYEDLSEESRKLSLIEADSKYDIQVMIRDPVDDILIGGYNAKNITISYSEIEGKEKMIFHVIEYSPKPLSKEEQYSMIMYLENNDDYKRLLRPTFE